MKGCQKEEDGSDRTPEAQRLSFACVCVCVCLCEGGSK